MRKTFIDFDFSTFWDNGEYALKEYVSETPSDELIASVESELGYKLPESYIDMMKVQNGGTPFDCYSPVIEPSSGNVDYTVITGVYGIGRKKHYSLCNEYGNQYMIDEWDYPSIGICICTCPSAGHDVIMLDYRKCGKNGEPEVVHVDDSFNDRVTFLAKDFETFIRGLVNEDVCDV